MKRVVSSSSQHRLAVIRPADHLNDGFSFIELIVVLAVLGVLLAIAGMRIPRDHLAAKQAAEALARDFQLVRFEAIRENEFVGLSVDAAADSYHFIVDMDRDQVLEPASGDIVSKTVRVREEKGATITTTLTYIFDPRGMAVRLEPAAVGVGTRSGDQAFSVCVSAQGRASVVQGVTCP